MTTRIALAQINSTVGDFTGNIAALVAAARAAHADGPRIFVAPELALSGYPPEDLLLRPAFYAQSAAALVQLAQALAPLQGLHVVVGHPYRMAARATARSSGGSTAAKAVANSSVHSAAANAAAAGVPATLLHTPIQH